MALEALSQYWISTYHDDDNNELQVTLSAPGKGLPTQISFGRSKPIQEELQVREPSLRFRFNGCFYCQMGGFPSPPPYFFGQIR